MGRISRFDLSKMIRDYKISFFFETGTFRGDGVEYALHSPFQKIISVEIIDNLADEARKRFSSPQVEIITAESAIALNAQLPLLKGNTIFWLDAHFPGADAGLSPYDREMEESLRLPLVEETAIISETRKQYRDIIIMDDLRIYEDGPYENGNAPADAMPKMNRNIDFIYRNFEATHNIYRFYQEEGYVLLLPRPKGALMGLFQRKHKPEEYIFS